ncbi:olfactory receptor 52K1-like [Rhinatrema bivittatum]|uniref:olfactory receptor 52K1-like n=1 Tax=Rhinatrema bivittatum TaxID=194408 RepID=UPI00112C9F97|nr:olfactory receptor 52K1-like [Rhinatrema bivittatum]
MLTSNDCNFSFSVFNLTGIPGLESWHHLISVPFCLVYTVALLVNGSILFIIKSEESLHSPMYLFLFMLAINDLFLPSCILPKMLSIFWFNAQEIHCNTCLVQMFFIHSLTTVESGILAAMAFDRYIAICDPLRYASILTNAVILKIGLLVIGRGVLVIFPLPFLIKRLPCCKTNVIHHSYCEHMAVVKLVCGDTTINNVYGLSIITLVIVLDMLFIALSYLMILRTVLRLPTKEARYKAFNTCTSHICVICISYVPGFFSSLTHRYGKNVAPYIHITLSSFYLLIPPMLNPIIYSVKTKQIRERAHNVFYQKKIIYSKH